MLTIPFIALLSQQLYNEFQLWLVHHGGDEEFANNRLVRAFMEDIEEGRYEVGELLREDAHRIYLELIPCITGESTIKADLLSQVVV